MTELKGARILIAENDVLVRNLVSTILSNEGHYILAAANDAEALELSRSFTGEIRLLIARKNGLAETIAQERAGIRILLLSSNISSQLKEIVHRVDPGAFLQQGLLPEKLRDSIERTLNDPDRSSTVEEV